VSGRFSVDVEVEWQGDYYDFTIPEGAL